MKWRRRNWFWILITVFIDIFRSPDLSGSAKALWFVFVLLIPLIGVLVYLMSEVDRCMSGRSGSHAVPWTGSVPACGRVRDCVVHMVPGPNDGLAPVRRR